MKRRELLINIVKHVLLIIYALFALFHSLWMLLISFKSDAQMFNTTFIFTPTLRTMMLCF